MRKTLDRKVEENDVHEEISPKVQQVSQGSLGFQSPPKSEQVPIAEGGNDVPVKPSELSNSDIREALLALSRIVTTQANLCMVPRVNVVERTMTSRLKDFVRMNSPTFVRSKIEEDAQQFLDGVYKVLSATRVTYREKIEGRFSSVVLSMEV